MSDELPEGSKWVPLTRGVRALVDLDDYERVVAAGPWFAHPDGRTTYAVRHVRVRRGFHTTEKMHKFLTGWPMTDHRNGDGLDNRRANLRPATRSQNNANAQKRSNNKSGFKGVHWDGRKWQAGIRLDGRQRYLGRFDLVEDAARAYDTAACALFGEFARLNFPPSRSAEDAA